MYSIKISCSHFLDNKKLIYSGNKQCIVPKHECVAGNLISYIPTVLQMSKNTRMYQVAPYQPNKHRQRLNIPNELISYDKWNQQCTAKFWDKLPSDPDNNVAHRK